MPLPIPESESAATPRWVGALTLAAIATGAALRFAWPADVEFKADERWMLERALDVGRLESWSWTGMESSVTLSNPGAGVWAFAALSRVFGLETPPALSMGVAACGVLSLVLAAWLAWRLVAPAEREAWLWGVTLAAVSPLEVLLQRKIWAQSLLPLAAVALWWCWWRRDRRGGALAWGALGMLMGQVHFSGFFLAAALAGWTRWRAGGPATRWRWWWAGTLAAALPLLPWAVGAVTALRTAAAAMDPGASGGVPWWNVLVPRFWALWVSEPTGLLVYSLGEHFTEFLRWPVLGGVPTWLMAVASAAAWTVLGRALWVGRRRLAEPVRRGSGGTMALLGAALVPMGALLTLTLVTIHRHYLIAAFPLPMVWLAGLALAPGGGMSRGRRWLLALVITQLVLSAGFLHYIHVRGGAPRGDYGVTWSMQERSPDPMITP